MLKTNELALTQNIFPNILFCVYKTWSLVERYDYFYSPLKMCKIKFFKLNMDRPVTGR